MEKTAVNETAQRKVLTEAEARETARKRTYDNQSRNSDDFSTLEISNVEFTGEDLSSSCFDYSRFVNVTFTGCKFRSAEFNYTVFENVRFVRCSMPNAEFNFAAMTGVEFSSTILDNSEFDFAHGDAVFSGCYMEYADFHAAALKMTVSDCSCRCAKFLGGSGFSIRASDSDFTEAAMNDAKISGVIENCDCAGMELKNSDCTRLEFKGCALRDIDAEGATGFAEKIEEGPDLDFLDEEPKHENE